ncbi:hypothetical protein A8B78_08910 [Jannaschia sp. EhC01]|nr:hypothetical protein A8B78_08910 [Jannaschia sp. EhC01]
MLSLAVLPLGVIAVLQTITVIEEARSLEQRDFLARTVQAASAEGGVLRRTYGVADALGMAAANLGDDAQACSDIMSDMVVSNTIYSFAGFIAADGMMRCSSGSEAVDFSGYANWQSFLAEPRDLIEINHSGAVTGLPVIIISVPVYESGTATLLGAASISIPVRLTDALLSAGTQDVALALLDEDGRILTAEGSADDLLLFNRLGITPSTMDMPATGAAFTATAVDGDDRLVTVVPLLEDRVFVAGIWQPGSRAAMEPFLARAAPVFPLLMWAATLAVAMLAVDRLVLRHLKRLRASMRSFSLDEPKDSYSILDNAPAEINDIAITYNRMVDRILADGRDLQETITEKELLLREVHHRVKNNLQLIASILNMQMRKISEGTSKTVLKRVQDRVMNLSSIHKMLYSGDTVSTAQADRLLEEVIQATLAIGIKPGAGVKIETHLEPLMLDPDQTVPLALLVTETLTNAAKYLGKPTDGAPRLEIRLDVDENQLVRLSIANTVGTRLQTDLATEGTGLGAKLIEAFAAQLMGEMDITHSDTEYRVTVTFKTHTDGPEKRKIEQAREADAAPRASRAISS